MYRRRPVVPAKTMISGGLPRSRTAPFRQRKGRFKLRMESPHQNDWRVSSLSPYYDRTTTLSWISLVSLWTAFTIPSASTLVS